MTNSPYPIRKEDYEAEINDETTKHKQNRVPVAVRFVARVVEYTADIHRPVRKAKTLPELAVGVANVMLLPIVVAVRVKSSVTR